MTLPVILSYGPSSSAYAKQLYDYTKSLSPSIKLYLFPTSKSEDDAFLSDPDTVSFLRRYPDARFPCLQAFGLRRAARFIQHRHPNSPFIHLEPDAVPRCRDWVEQLTTEYYRLRKPFLLSSDSHPPHDLIGGIGVYPPDTAGLVPVHFPTWGWDKWLLAQPNLLGRTPLIQHTYGVYFNEHSEPMRRQTLLAHVRDDAVVFHRDKYLDLLPPTAHTFYHTGDLGDIIAFLPIIRHFGGGHLVIGNHPPPIYAGWRAMEGASYEFIRPLLEVQPYIRSVSSSRTPPEFCIDLTHWRVPHYNRKRPLTYSQAESIGVNPFELSLAPWIQCAKSKPSAPCIAVTRSARYHNDTFPWTELVTRYRNQMFFFGTPEEHKSFVKSFGKVRYKSTRTMLDLARELATSTLHIGNQSCPFWLAAGLGIPTVQETHELLHDSILPIPNTFYWTGRTSLDKLSEFIDIKLNLA